MHWFIFYAMVRKMKKILSDVFYSLFSSAFPLILLQLFILPSVASSVSAEYNGLILTIISLITIFSSTFGNSLNNARLLTEKEIGKDEKGDYNLLILFFSVLNVIFLMIAIRFLNLDVEYTFLIVSSSVAYMLIQYYIVYYRIDINYQKVLISNIFLCIGYIIGFFLFKKTRIWILIYFLGYAFSLLYILYQNPLFKEPIKITKNFKKVVSVSSTLLLVTFIASLLNYIDRLILFPILGGEMVSIYYSASLIGKLGGMVVSPINSVVLSYIVKIKEIKLKQFLSVLAVLFILIIIGYFLSVFVAKPILHILYAQWADESMKYIPITTLTAMITIATTVLNPFILNWCHTKWQLVINVIYLIVYLFLSFSLIDLFGLYGFCIGFLMATIIKFVLMIFVFIKFGNYKS